MKLLHIADLHIGRRIGEFNLIEDQKYVLWEILRIIDENEIKGVLIAGDVYDKSMPSGEAVLLLDEFLTEIVARKVPVFMANGNHDSAERLNFGSRIMMQKGLHIVSLIENEIRKETIQDGIGNLNIYILPYIKPALVRPFFENAIETYEEAMRSVIGSTKINSDERNVLIAHQFITSAGQQPIISDSESLSVGGLDNIDASVFDGFDYVALGHLHGPQRIGRDTVRYAGSPLKYSFSESRQNKSVTIIEFATKSDITITLVPLPTLRDMREIKGPLKALLEAGLKDKSQDYMHATITDEEEIYDAVGQLRQVYPNLMSLDFENSKTVCNLDSKTAASGDVSRKTPMELFDEFYQNQNNKEPSSEQTKIMQEILEKAGGANI